MVDTLYTYHNTLLAASSNSLAAGHGCCCGAGSWFDVWTNAAFVNAMSDLDEAIAHTEENWAEVRYANIYPVNYADIYARSKFFNSFTSKGFSTHPTEHVFRTGEVFHIQNGVWCLSETRRADNDPSLRGLLSCYAPNGDQRFSEEFNPAWIGHYLTTSCTLFGIPIAYVGISTVYVRTNPGNGPYDYLENVVDLFNGGVIEQNTDTNGNGIIPFEVHYRTFGMSSSSTPLSKPLSFHVIETGGQHSDTPDRPTVHSVSRSILSDSAVPHNIASANPFTDLDIFVSCDDHLPYYIKFWLKPNGYADFLNNGNLVVPCAQVVETTTEAAVAVPFQGYPFACGVYCNEISGFTIFGPGTLFCTATKEIVDGYTLGNPKTHGMFLELRVGRLIPDAHWQHVEGRTAIRVDYTATYNFDDGVAAPNDQHYKRRVFPIYGEWLCFDSRGEDGLYAGIVRYDNIPTYGDPFPQVEHSANDFNNSGIVGGPGYPVDPTRTSKVALIIDGAKAIEFTFPGLDLPWGIPGSGFGGFEDNALAKSFYLNSGGPLTSPDLGIGDPHVVMNGITVVIRKVYSVEPNGANPNGALLNTLKPWAFCLYKGATEIWRSPLLINEPDFKGFSPRWIYFNTLEADGKDSYITGGHFLDRVFPFADPGRIRRWLVNYSGSEVVPAGVLTDDPTVMTELTAGPPGQFIPYTLPNYTIYAANDKFTLPATFAEMFANRYAT